MERIRTYPNLGTETELEHRLKRLPGLWVAKRKNVSGARVRSLVLGLITLNMEGPRRLLLPGETILNGCYRKARRKMNI